MPKVNVYLPDELAAAVRDAQVPVSAVCQVALEKAVRDVTALRAADDSVWRTIDQATYGPLGRFTPRARSAVQLARAHAEDLGRGVLGTEHLLLGVIDEGGNLALKVLAGLEVEPADVRSELLASAAAAGSPSASAASSAGEGDDGESLDPSPADVAGDLAFTPPAKQAFEATTKEALTLGHNYIGCEHLLLGLLATEDGLASQVLRRMGVELRTTRMAVVTALFGLVHGQAPAPAPAPAPAASAVLDEILRRVEAIEQRLAG